MGKTAVVTGTFNVSWDIDEFRETWGEDDMTDEEIAQECLESVMDSPMDYIDNLVHFEVAVA